MGINYNVCDYTSDSEYVRDLVRRDQESVLRTAVLEGLQSGISNRNVLDIIEDAKAKMVADGKLSLNT